MGDLEVAEARGPVYGSRLNLLALMLVSHENWNVKRTMDTRAQRMANKGNEQSEAYGQDNEVFQVN